MITLTNGKQEKSFWVGYAWHLFFFGPFGMLFNAEYKLSAIFFAIEYILFHIPNLVLLYNVPCIIFAFFYSRMRIKKYVDKGWYAIDNNDNQQLIRMNIYTKRHFI